MKTLIGRLGWRITTMILPLTAVGLGCMSAEPDRARAPTPVRAHVVAEVVPDPGQRYSASVTAYTQVALSFKVSGYISDILQREGADGRQRDLQAGDVIRRGAVVARVQDAEYRDKVQQAEAQLASALASLEKGREDFGRSSFLFELESATAPEFERARKEFEVAAAQVANARAALAEARLSLGYCALNAPMDGVVLQRNIEVGSLVGPGSVGFVMADVSRVKVVFGVPAGLLGEIQLGQAMAIRTEAVADTVFPGILTAISPAANSRSRVFSIEVTVPNATNQLKPGMVASLELETGTPRQPLVVVPLRAVIRSPASPGGYALFVIEQTGVGAVARVRDVQLGEVYGDTIEVRRGLAPGERVIVSGQTMVRDGQRVRLIV